MKNTLIMDTLQGCIYSNQIVSEQNEEDILSIRVENASANPKLDIYWGNEYAETIDMELSEDATATLDIPKKYYQKGNMLKVRFKDDNAIYKFMHFIHDAKIGKGLRVEKIVNTVFQVKFDEELDVELNTFSTYATNGKCGKRWCDVCFDNEKYIYSFINYGLYRIDITDKNSDWETVDISNLSGGLGGSDPDGITCFIPSDRAGKVYIGIENYDSSDSTWHFTIEEFTTLTNSVKTVCNFKVQNGSSKGKFYANFDNYFIEDNKLYVVKYYYHQSEAGNYYDNNMIYRFDFDTDSLNGNERIYLRVLCSSGNNATVLNPKIKKYFVSSEIIKYNDVHYATAINTETNILKLFRIEDISTFNFTEICTLYDYSYNSDIYFDRERAQEATILYAYKDKLYIFLKMSNTSALPEEAYWGLMDIYYIYDFASGDLQKKHIKGYSDLRKNYVGCNTNNVCISMFSKSDKIIYNELVI